MKKCRKNIRVSQVFKKLRVLSIDRALVCIIIFSVLTLLVMGYIFYNSSQNSKESNAKSNVIAETIQKIVDPAKKINEKSFHKGVRKAAHFFEFALLGFSLGGVMVGVYGKTKRIFTSLPLLLSLGVAVTDEFIQSFTGRTSKVMDVLIDFSGSVTGLLLMLLAVLCVGQIRRKKITC